MPRSVFPRFLEFLQTVLHCTAIRQMFLYTRAKQEISTLRTTAVANQVQVLLLSGLFIISWHSILAFVYIHNSQGPKRLKHVAI